MKKKFRKRYNQGWEPFGPATLIIPTVTEYMERTGCSGLDAEKYIQEIRKRCGKEKVFKNNLYQVLVQEHGEGCLWLSIKRLDREPIHDWRDLQRIKNELTDPEFEAVEIYPAESRLIDESNQYHLFVLTTGERIPFGYQYRSVLNPEEARKFGAKQRPFK